MNSVVGTHDPEEIDTEIGTAYRTIHRLERSIQEPIAKKLAETFRTKIEDFKEHLPVISTLGNPSMKSRHWEQVSEIIGFPIKIDQWMTLAKVRTYIGTHMCSVSLSQVKYGFSLSRISSSITV